MGTFGHIAVGVLIGVVAIAAVTAVSAHFAVLRARSRRAARAERPAPRYLVRVLDADGKQISALGFLDSPVTLAVFTDEELGRIESAARRFGFALQVEPTD